MKLKKNKLINKNQKSYKESNFKGRKEKKKKNKYHQRHNITQKLHMLPHGEGDTLTLSILSWKPTFLSRTMLHMPLKKHEGAPHVGVCVPGVD